MNVVIFLLKYFILSILSILILISIVFIARKYNFISQFIKNHYFKIKFKIVQTENSNLNTRRAVNKFKIFFYNIYFKLLSQIIFFFNEPQESFKILKEELQEKHGEEIKVVIKKGRKEETINIKEISNRIKIIIIKLFNNSHNR